MSSPVNSATSSITTNITNPVASFNSIPMKLNAKDIERTSQTFNIDRDSNENHATGVISFGSGQAATRFDFEYTNLIGSADELILADPRASKEHEIDSPERLSFITNFAKTDLPKTFAALKNAVKTQATLHSTEGK